MFFPLWAKQFPKIKHNALVSQRFNQWLKRKAAHMHSIRCPGAIDAQLSACPAQVVIIFDCMCRLVSPISGLFNGGNRKSSNLNHVSQSKSSNMLEENIGAPCSLEYASSASNMPQIGDQENASNIFKYITSQSASRLAQGMAQHIQKNPKR